MILRFVFLILAAVCFVLSAAEVRHPRISIQSLGLLFLTAGLLAEAWFK